MALIIVADIFVPRVAVEFSCAQSAQKEQHLRTSHVYGTTVFVAPLRREQKGGPPVNDRKAPFPRRRPGYGLKPSGILLELELPHIVATSYSYQLCVLSVGQ